MASFKPGCPTGKVMYGVSDRMKAPLSRLYFCRHCLKLRSSDCVSHEVDCHYCPNCLDHLPVAEAHSKDNRCSSCFDCPSCHHTLSTRATSVAVPDPENPSKTIPKKVYYLACGFCRWTSRDVGIKDQPVASGGWQKRENPHTKRIKSLLDYYHQLAAREKAEKEKKKFIRRRNYLHLSDRYGLASLSARKRTGLLGVGSLSLKDSDDTKIIEVEPGTKVTTFDELPDDIYTQPVQLTKMCNIVQRVSCPEFQPSGTGSLYPYPKCFVIKKSQRCRECEHNLSKAEFNPSSIKFKIQLVALHHVPDIKIMSPPLLQFETESAVVLTLVNPLDNLTHVTLTQIPEDASGTNWCNAKVTLPSCVLVLSPRDDAAEFDDSSDQQSGFNDDTSVVVFRKANKIGFVIKVNPQNKEDSVKIGFLMKYDYRNMTTALQSENKEPELVWLQHPVYIDLGPLSAKA